MLDLALYRARLSRKYRVIIDARGGNTVKRVGMMGEVNKHIGEVRSIVAEMLFSLAQLQNRTENDPNFSRFNCNRWRIIVASPSAQSIARPSW